MTFLTLVGKEMRMLSRNLVLYLLIAVVLLFFYGNYATSESWNAAKAPVPPDPKLEQMANGKTGQTNVQPTAPAGAEGSGGSAAGAPAASPGSAASAAPVAVAAQPGTAGTAAPETGTAQPGTDAPPPLPVYGLSEVTDPGKIAQRYQWSIEADLENGWMDQRIFFGSFAHKSKLSEADRKAMKAAVEQFKQIAASPAGHTATEVKQVAADLDEKLGGWTNYMRDGMTFIDQITNYEAAMEHYRADEAEYRQRVEEHQLIPGMARLFADYMGITAGIFPVFLAAFALGRDRASRMDELIGSRRIKALTYVGARFFAYALTVSLVYVLVSVLAAWETAANLGDAVGFLEALPTFLAYGTGWLLPTVWATTAFGMLIYTIFGSGLAAIPLQVAWWLISALPLIGSYGPTKLFLRFNTPTEAATYRHYADTILLNRVSYTVLAFLLAAAAAWLWERRRSLGRSARGRKRRRAAAEAVAAGGASR